MAKARGQITITDLNDAKSLYAYLDTNHPKTQTFTEDSTNQYDPDYTKAPLIITPQVFISGSATAVTSLEAVSWKINGSGTLSTYGGTVPTSGANIGKLVINKNMVGTNNKLHIEYAASWTDTDTYLPIPIKTSIDFYRADNGASLVFAEIQPLNNTGYTFHNKDVSSITLKASLKRGNNVDTDKVTYQWKKNGEVINNATNDTLEITPSMVDGSDVFGVDITDTDSTSSTSGKVFHAEETIVDLSDPYQVRIDPSTTTLLNGQGTAVLTAVVIQAGKEVESGLTYAWSKIDDSGNAVSWTPSVQGQTKTKKSITVNKNDITRRATFVCEVSII